ncbi:MAG: sigma-70 family RNA polymerase sigma factor [Puia sp.]|nr:sigma-70 family RNA polymerase sigma factor [Puia sp.]
MTDAKVPTDEDILAGILSNRLNEVIHSIYRQYAGMVGAYVVTHGGSEQDGEDIFQETVVAFIDLVKKGKYRGEASIRTFLVSIAKNIWFNEVKKKKSLDNRGRVFEINKGETDADVTEGVYKREVTQQLLSLMDQLGESCKAILTFFYFEGLSFKEIVEKMQYENDQVVRNKKYKCMKELTDLIRDNPVLADSIQ